MFGVNSLNQHYKDLFVGVYPPSQEVMFGVNSLNQHYKDLFVGVYPPSQEVMFGVGVCVRRVSVRCDKAIRSASKYVSLL